MTVINSCGKGKFEEKITLEEAIVLTNTLVEKKLVNVKNEISQMSSYLTKSRGKGIRTWLLLCSAMRDDGMLTRAAVEVAASIELLHMATLVHDDVIDNAPLRRGLETVQKKFGVKEAIICGDFLLCLAMTTLSELLAEDTSKYTKLVTVITKALAKICEGEYKQLLWNGNLNIGAINYLRIIHGKTSALFFSAAYCGALVSGCDEKELRSISQFGRYLGMSFQIADDCIDYEFSEEQAKKPVKNDIVTGVVTLPLILAIQSDLEIKQLAKEVMLNNIDVAKLTKAVIDVGALKNAKAVALRYRDKAKSSISGIKNENKKKHLLGILGQMSI